MTLKLTRNVKVKLNKNSNSCVNQWVAWRPLVPIFSEPGPLSRAGKVQFNIDLVVYSFILENMEMGEDTIFVPMTNSLLVPGKMAEGNMLVELGGGIMMEKSVEGKFSCTKY